VVIDAAAGINLRIQVEILPQSIDLLECLGEVGVEVHLLGCRDT